LKRSLKTKLPRYNDVEECQYVWQENELADCGQWLLRQLLLLAGEGCGGQAAGSTCGTALLFTYNSPPAQLMTQDQHAPW